MKNIVRIAPVLASATLLFACSGGLFGGDTGQFSGSNKNGGKDPNSLTPNADGEDNAVNGNRGGGTTGTTGGLGRNGTGIDRTSGGAGPGGTNGRTNGSGLGTNGSNSTHGGQQNGGNGSNNAEGGNGSLGGSEQGITGGDQISLNLTEKLILRQLYEGGGDADCANEVTLSLLDQTGAVVRTKTVPFPEDKPFDYQLDDFCYAKQDTTLKMVVHMLECGTDARLSPSNPGDLRYIQLTGGGGLNWLEVTFDDGGGSDGVRRGKDNTFHLECPHRQIRIQGL